jgi:diguanylate cyclase (GGDEF)-like protein/PAS domain S-box-containing protein
VNAGLPLQPIAESNASDALLPVPVGQHADDALVAELRELRLVEAFLDHSGEAFFAIRAGDGRVVYVNAAAERLYGYSQAEMLGMTVDQVSAAYDGVDMAERMSEYRERGRIVFETLHRAKDGSTLPVEVTLSYVRGEHGDHTVGVVRNLQERRRMAAALQEAEQRWKIAVDASERGVWDWQADTDRIFFSARCATMLGYPPAPSTPLRSEWIQQVHPADRASLQVDIECQLGGDAPLFSNEHRARAKDGSYLWVQARGRVVRRDADGRALRMVGTLTDIDERVRAEDGRRQALEQLRGSEQILRQVQSIARIGSWVYDLASQHFSAEPDVAQMCGWSDGAPQGIAQASAQVHADDLGMVERAFADAVAGQPSEVEYRLTTAGGVRWVRQRIDTARRQSAVAGQLVGVVQDISGRKRRELVQLTRTAVLDLVLRSPSAAAVYGEIAGRLEEVQTDWHVSIVLVDPAQANRLTCAAAPSLPDWYCGIVDTLHAGVGVGTCGTAIAQGRTQLSADIAADPNWAAWPVAVRRLGLHACWSQPFKDDGGVVRGSLAVYRRQPGLPRRSELELIEEFARIAALAEQRVRAAEALRQAAAVFENTHDGVVITDTRPAIVAVNKAYCAITGYSAEQLVGSNPSLLKSGRHDRSFYAQMWQALAADGHWQGELWNRRASGEIYPQWVTLSVVRDDAGQPSHFVGVCTDITQAKRSEVQLERLAHYDALTGLPNRLLAQSRLAHAVERAARQQLMLAVVFIDLDHFKTVNDSLGHPAGDELLSAFAARAQGRLRAQDTLARLGGDEFLLILENVTAPQDPATVAQALLDTLKLPFTLSNGLELFVSASMGIALYPQDGRDVDSLIQHADSAMYQAKTQGRHTLRFYTDALTRHANERLALEAALRRALVNDELTLHYQPQLTRCADGRLRIDGVEALVRWQHPELGLVQPARFIALAEDTGLIHALGDWVLAHACAQARRWHDAGWALQVAVNLSARQFSQRDLVGKVRQVLVDTGLPPSLLELEITESALIEHPEPAIATLSELRDLGVAMAVDDFGTGYSSLAYLKRLPVGRLKIDRSFVAGLPGDRHDRAIVQAIVTMAHSLDMQTLAEGVEQPEQWDSLAELGCDGLQGFVCCPALPVADIDAALGQGRLQVNGQAVLPPLACRPRAGG